MAKSITLYIVVYCLLVVAVGVFVILKSTWADLTSLDVISLALLHTHAITQSVYLMITRKLLKWEEFKQVDTLDGFYASEDDSRFKIVGISSFAKVIGVLNLFGVFIVLMGSGIVVYNVLGSIGLDWDMEVAFVFLTALILLGTGVMTLLYNVRTFNTKRLMPITAAGQAHDLPDFEEID